jgi:hypothetical protein
MPEVAFVTIGPNELEHVIRLASATVASGDTIHIWSVIRNADGDRLSLAISDDLLSAAHLPLDFREIWSSSGPLGASNYYRAISS